MEASLRMQCITTEKIKLNKLTYYGETMNRDRDSQTCDNMAIKKGIDEDPWNIS